MERILKILLISFVLFSMQACGVARLKTQNAELISQTKQLQQQLVEQTKSHAESDSKQREYNEVFQKTIMAYYENIPASHTQQKVATTDLGELIEGSGFTASSGQATLDIRRQGDSLLIRAECKGLAQKVEYLQHQNSLSSLKLDSLQSRYDDQSTKLAQTISQYEQDLKFLEAVKKKPSLWG